MNDNQTDPQRPLTSSQSDLLALIGELYTLRLEMRLQPDYIAFRDLLAAWRMATDERYTEALLRQELNDLWRAGCLDVSRDISGNPLIRPAMALFTDTETKN